MKARQRPLRMRYAAWPTHVSLLLCAPLSGVLLLGIAISFAQSSQPDLEG